MEKINPNLFYEAIHGAVNYLVLHKDEVNALNVFPVPDGDTGTNMSLTSKSALKQVEAVGERTAESLSKACAKGSLMGARGNSGVILSQFLRGFSEGCEGQSDLSVAGLAFALRKASETTYNAVMKPTEGTILTVGRELSDFAVKNHKQYTDIVVFLEAILAAANASLAKTPEKLKVLKEAGVVDAGGKGLCILIEGALRALKGEVITSEDDEILKKKAQKEVSFSEANEDIKYGYCTEFIIHTDYDDLEAFKKKLSPLGDCLLVVGGGGTELIKVHVHTNEPGVALQHALELGPLQDIKIDNMRFQHAETLFSDEQVEAAREEETHLPTSPHENYALIAVSMGSGITDMFQSIGVERVVEGGQTMNPSTEDFLKAIDSVRAHQVILLPNNSNIILAAEQAAKISAKDVIVIPSKTVPQGISAILGFDDGADIETNRQTMTSQMADVVSAQVTYAVRDTTMNGKVIEKDDIIGLSGKEIVASGKDIDTVTRDLIRDLVTEEHSIITLFAGDDVTEEDSEALRDAVAEEFDELDVELIQGKQPIYYYLIAVE
ncbi:DAK2 domain-containing protein [Peptoniphilus equinus]|uniref:DAK2 domain-containing protein n=1 Tax=Peptoniphilus equinus TaxID=3016343 RepID=A0ABY7QS07_9FIRM|nr:DAK2 domain-containing protein [Peptoniphilus equinus]WBW49581.1 DAK2 domain-containing protein [Peptoniphilus equinus]